MTEEMFEHQAQALGYSEAEIASWLKLYREECAAGLNSSLETFLVERPMA